MANDNVNADDDSLEFREDDFGDMNEKDARESGYTDENGKAVDMARENKRGSPTGAFTDIGAGRSSVVVKKSEARQPPSKMH